MGSVSGQEKGQQREIRGASLPQLPAGNSVRRAPPAKTDRLQAREPACCVEGAAALVVIPASFDTQQQ